VWGDWKNPKTGKWERTYATFTSEPNKVMKEIHERQPIILDPKDFGEWLSRSVRPPTHLLRILPEDAIQAILQGAPVIKPKEPPPTGNSV
jgi:putative SOS response-associated peptidase YedK